MSVELSRRAILAGTGAAAVTLVAGCATYDSSAPVAEPPAADGAPPDGDPVKPLAAAADVPVGGGVVTAQGVVVTQPTAGTFLGFTAICTHAGCTVGGVSNGLITCPCHGSAFKVADGSVAQGPANRPLKAIPVKLNGTSIELA